MMQHVELLMGAVTMDPSSLRSSTTTTFQSEKREDEEEDAGLHEFAVEMLRQYPRCSPYGHGDNLSRDQEEYETAHKIERWIHAHVDSPEQFRWVYRYFILFILEPVLNDPPFRMKRYFDYYFYFGCSTQTNGFIFYYYHPYTEAFRTNAKKVLAQTIEAKYISTRRKESLHG
jgi:hypothetical protein